MPARTLLRFLDPTIGPVVSIVSVSYPGFWRRWFWHSTAKLHSDWASEDGYKILQPCGGGWSRDKEESQCKAVTEAIERWCFRWHARFDPEAAGLNIDPTSTGFAATPRVFGVETAIRNAYCEAAERWLMARLWDAHDVSLREAELNSKLHKLFGTQIRLFTATFHAGDTIFPIHNSLFFCLALIDTDDGGVLPGSACGIDFESTAERAILEGYIHIKAYARMKKEKLTSLENIVEARISFFAGNPNARGMVELRLNHPVTARQARLPRATFSKDLPGPWNPEVLVHRILLDGARPFTEGGAERFII